MAGQFKNANGGLGKSSTGTCSAEEARADLIESDRAYFQAGSIIKELPGGVIMTSAAGADYVLLVDDLDKAAADVAAWLSPAMTMVARTPHGRLRVYLSARRSDLSKALADAGLVERVELLFFGTPHVRAMSTATLTPVESADAWRAKEAFHDQAAERPDGYHCSARDWTAFEKIKVRALGMRCYLVRRSAEVVGSVATIQRAGYRRVKNLVVHPDYRRQGVAQEILTMLARPTGAGEIVPLGMLAVADSSGEALYRSVGLGAMGEYYEWSLPLTANRTGGSTR